MNGLRLDIRAELRQLKPVGLIGKMRPAQKIGPMVSGEARGKGHPHSKSFAPRLESRGFDKLQEVGVFLLLSLVFG